MNIIPTDAENDNDETEDNEIATAKRMMRMLWALVERAGGTVTISGDEAGMVSGGEFTVAWSDDSITVSTRPPQ